MKEEGGRRKKEEGRRNQNENAGSRHTLPPAFVIPLLPM
jgi:hypothetical protein